MAGKGESMVPGSLRPLLIAACALLLVVSPVGAVEPTGAAPQLADGTRTVQGSAIQGARRCGDWLVRLTNSGGQLSGIVSLARSSVVSQRFV
jgi:hypothetical protein